MTIWTVTDIERLGAGATVHLRPGDRLTPLARDRAVELGITLRADDQVHGEQRLERRARPQPEPPQPDPPRGASPSGALYRRALPLQSFSRFAGGGRLRRIGIVGVGHVGATAASLIATSGLADELCLLDVAPGLAAGTALDISHMAGLKDFTTEVSAVDSVAQLQDADVVLVTAGRPRRPGMSRSDLLGENAAIVAPLAESLGRIAPDTILIVVTNPVDEMTELAYRASGLAASRVMGMAGVLDAARFRALAARAAGVRARELEALALGSHGDEMVIPQTLARIDGQPLAELLGADSLQALVEQTRNAGAEIVRLLGSGSAYFAPAASLERMVAAIANDSGEVVGACARADGHYGIHGVFVGLPVRLGRTGVREVLELELDPSERQALHQAAEAIRRRCGELPVAART